MQLRVNIVTDPASEIQNSHPDPPRKVGMPLLVKFLIRHAAIGFGFASVFVGALIWMDIGSIGTILAQSDIRIFATALLVMMVGLTFSSVQMGYAVMSNPDLLGGGSGGSKSRASVDQASKLTPLQIKATSTTTHS